MFYYIIPIFIYWSIKEMPVVEEICASFFDIICPNCSLNESVTFSISEGVEILN